MVAAPPASGFCSSAGSGFIFAAAAIASLRASSRLALPEQAHRAVECRHARPASRRVASSASAAASRALSAAA